MDQVNDYSDIQKEKRNQILKLVTNSFYKELVNYGVDASDIVTVSVNLLDHVTQSQHPDGYENGFYNDLFHPEDVKNHWSSEQVISYNGVSLIQLCEEHIPVISGWLDEQDVRQTFISFFPKENENLANYLLRQKDRRFFAIKYADDHFVGIVGAENMDNHFKKLEMKKFVGDTDFRGKGIGKISTFLFLYYAFEILEFNKVFINSLDTNIKNLNLNSKFGFELEGILYEEACLGGLFRDVLRMSLLRKTWRKIFF